MAESTETKSIRELTRVIREEREKSRADDEDRARRYSGRTAEEAQKRLDKADEQLATQRRISGFSERRIKKADVLNGAIDKQKEIMSAQKTELESLGIDTKNNKKFQKEELKLAKLEKSRAKVTGSADAEDAAKKKIADQKGNTFLGKIAGGITGIAKQGMQKVKSGLGGLSKFLMGGLAVAALAFLNNPKFEEIKNTIIDVVVPALAFLYDEIIKPIAEYIGGKLTDLFTDLKSYVDGEKGLGAVLTENIGIISAIALLLAPAGTVGLLFSALKFGVVGIGKILLWASAKTGITAFIIAKIAVIKTAFIAVGNFLTGFLAPIKAIGLNIAKFTGVAALVVGVVFGIYKGIESAIDEFKATGNIWETVKVFLSNFLAEGVGIILNPIKDALSWIIGKVGEIFGIESITSSVTEILDNFDFVDGIKAMGNAISGLFSFIVDKVQSIIRAIPVFGDDVADALFGTKPEQEAVKKAKEEEQKVLEKQRRAYKEQQKLEKEAAEAEKLKKMKEQQAVSKVPVFERLGNPRGAQAPAQNTVINAPNNVNAPTTTTLTTASTSIINTDRVTDKLSIVA